MNEGSHRTRSLRVLMVTLACLVACEQTVAAPIVPAGTPLQYRFEFDWEDAMADGGVRVVTTNLGYRVGVETLYIGVGAIELVSCDQDTSSETASWWRRVLGPSRAFADHGWISDSTRAEPSLAENALGEESWVGPVQASETSYCELFWALTPLEAAAADGTELVRTSMRFEGWFEDPRTGERTALSTELRIGRGAIVPLSQGWDATRSVVRFTRFPARAFADIEFAELTADEAITDFALQLLSLAEAEFALPE